MKTPNPRFIALVSAWGFAAFVAGAFHAQAKVPPLGLPFLIGVPTVALALGALGTGWVGAGLRALGLPALLLFNVFRFVGFYFIWLQAHGRLPAEFAERAGWGDVVVAAGAVLLLLMPRVRASRGAFLAWNLIGLIDLLIAVGPAAWLSATRPGSMAEITGLPLALIPLWLVPLYLASHVFMMRAPGDVCAAGNSPTFSGGRG
jgi:hypothetical protein